MLLQYQKNNLEKLRDAIKQNTELAIVGSVGSGRKYVVEQWSKELSDTIVLKLEPTGFISPCFSLETALTNIEYVRRKKLKIKSSFSISSFLGSVSASLESDSVCKNQEKLIEILKDLSKKHTIVFLIDKSLDINDGSITVINNFMNAYKRKRKIYRIYVSDTKENDIENIFFYDLSTSKSHKLDVLKDLNLNCNINISEKVIDFIFANINNNVKLLIEIIEDLNNNDLDCNIELFDNNNRIQKLLDVANKNYEYKKQLYDLLTICSISEHYFQSIDFAYLLKEHESVINLLLDYAQNHYLLDKNEESFYVLFGVVKKIYAALDECNKRNLYIGIVRMFENIHPSNYYQKYIFAKLAEMKEYRHYLIQHIFTQIRLNHSFDLSQYNNELDSKELNLINIYNKAVGYNNSKEYEKCLEELSKLRGLGSEFLYEINIIKSQALIKRLDENSRQMAVSLLNGADAIQDEYLRFRLNVRKIATQVHIGEYAKALNMCEETIGYLIDKLDETHALEYELYINVIYRKYSFVSDYETSINQVNQSVIFFRKNKKEYYKGYYIALVNLFSLYIINMRLSKASETKKELEELLITMNSYSFPRKEIMENNMILYNFFSDIKNPQEACDAFKKLYDDTSKSADNVLIASNYAIFLMLNNEFSLAEKVLLDKVPDTDEDLEGIYDTRIKINLAICRFLSNNDNRENSIKMLNSVDYNMQAPYYKVRIEELNNIKTLMSNIKRCNDANKWCEAFKASLTTPFTSYTTYQQGFVYTTLFNWDDD